MVRYREEPGRTRTVCRRLARRVPYDCAGEDAEKGGKQGVKEEGQANAAAADRCASKETTDLRLHRCGKAARHRGAIPAVSAYAVAIAHPLARSTASRYFFTMTSASGGTDLRREP